MKGMWPDFFQSTGFAWGCGLLGVGVVVVCVAVLVKLWRWNRLVKIYDSRTSFLSPWWQRSVQLGVAALSFLFILFLLSWRPWVWEESSEQTIEGQHVFFLIDVSRSMWIEDIAPSRLEAVKRAIEVSVRKAGHSNAYGLMVFASSFYFVSPLTTDVDTFLFLLKHIEPGMLQDQGTRLAHALGSLLDLTDEVLAKANLSETQSLPTFVVISDGEDFSKTPFKLKGHEQYQGRFVFVGVGQDKPMPVPLWIEGRKTYLFDQRGKMVMSRPNVEGMKRLAQITGSVYHSFSDAVFEKILQSPLSTSAMGQVIQSRVQKPQYGWWGVLVCFLLLIKVLWRYRMSVWGITLFLSIEGLMYGSPLSLWRHHAAQEAFRKDDVEGARKHLTKNITDEDAAKVELYNLGVVEAEKGDPGAAQRHFSESLSKGSEDIHHQPPSEQKAQVYGHFNQGVMAYRQGNPDEALKNFKQSLDEARQIPAQEPWVDAFKENVRWHMTQSMEAVEKKQQQQQQGKPGEQTEAFKEDESSQRFLTPDEQGDKLLLENKPAEKKDAEGEKQEVAGADQDRSQAEALRKRLLEQKLRQEMEQTDMRPMMVKPRQDQSGEGRTDDAGPAY